jgi:uncharacterized repeat protein (TIGR02543 family)
MATITSGTTNHWRSRCDYSTSETGYAVTITANGGFESVSWGFSIGSGITTTLTVGSNTASGTGGFSSASSATTYKSLASGSWSVSKTKSAQTVTVSARTVNSSGYMNADLTASTTVTVPALESHTVSFSANGGTGAPSSMTKWYGEVITLPTAKPTRTGYTFAGWYCSKDGSTYAAGQKYGYDVDITLTAVWTENTYTVSYDANGGTGAPASQTKKYTETLKLSSTVPTRTNYTFGGWATSSTGAAAYQAGGSYTTNADAKLYAVWSLAYKAPSVTSGSAFRCDSSGAASDTGEYFSASFAWSIDTTALATNAVQSVAIEYRAVATSAWTSATTSGAGVGSTSGTTTALAGKISTDSAYEVRFTLTDSQQSAYKTATVTKAAFIIDVSSDGKGIGLLTAAPSSGIELGSALPIKSGGTGRTSAPSMLTNLGSTTAASPLTASPRPGVTGTLPISKGGTGKTSAADALSALGGIDQDTLTAQLHAKNYINTRDAKNGVSFNWSWPTLTIYIDGTQVCTINTSTKTIG